MEYIARIVKEGRQTLVEFPDCPGCQTFAKRGEDALAVGREALEGWLEIHLEDGDAPPRPAFRPTSRRGSFAAIRIDPALAIRLAIRWARQDAHLSQGELAERVGVSRQQISLLESQGGNVTVGTLVKIARALGREVEVSLVTPSAA